MKDKLSKIYYSPKGYWKGVSAIEKLAKAAGVSKKEAGDFLKKTNFVANFTHSSKVRSESKIQRECA